MRGGSAKSRLPPRNSARRSRDSTEQQLDTPYRPDGWTVRQVVHHLADSHLNAYIRFRLALTEDQPTIKPYDQSKWAELPDARTAPVETSLQLIDGLHQRLVVLLRSMSEADFARTFLHPERGVMRLDLTVAMYAWHSRHHARAYHGAAGADGLVITVTTKPAAGASNKQGIMA